MEFISKMISTGTSIPLWIRFFQIHLSTLIFVYKIIPFYQYTTIFLLYNTNLQFLIFLLSFPFSRLGILCFNIWFMIPNIIGSIYASYSCNTFMWLSLCLVDLLVLGYTAFASYTGYNLIRLKFAVQSLLTKMLMAAIRWEYITVSDFLESVDANFRTHLEKHILDINQKKSYDTSQSIWKTK